MSIARLNELFNALNVSASAVAKVDGLTSTVYHIDLHPSLIGLPSNIKPAIQRALMGQEIKLLECVKGTPYMGIEVANELRDTVAFNQKPTTKGLQFIVGKSNDGIVVNDLSTMPHLLVAGQTGSGKSVFLNSLIANLLENNSPEDLIMHLIDPKQVELNVFAEHACVRTFSTNAKSALDVLNSAIKTMNERYATFSNSKCRNIEDYRSTGKKMPYIVVIFDEYADFMLEKATATRIESAISNIAAKARAAGIHLVLATQRPSVDVVTGTIKANLPFRVAFRTASATDSRTIIGNGEAAKLIGRGDMLIGTEGNLMRVQGTFIDRGTIESIVTASPRRLEPAKAKAPQRIVVNYLGDRKFGERRHAPIVDGSKLAESYLNMVKNISAAIINDLDAKARQF